MEPCATVITDASLPTVGPYPCLLPRRRTTIGEEEEIIAAYCIGSLARHVSIERTKEIKVEDLYTAPTAGVGVLNELPRPKGDIERLPAIVVGVRPDLTNLPIVCVSRKA